MARLRVILLILTLCVGYMSSRAQGTIAGKIVSAVNKSGLSGASVFLNNATLGTTTDNNGNFTLRNVRPGQYQLVVSNVGFEEHMQTIMVNNTLLNLNNIELLPKVTELRPVIITTNADWKKNYESFKKDFIGTSDNAKQCKVVNPRVVSLAYYGSKRLLEAYADEFLVVENHALGYRVKYLIKDFKSDKIANIISYQGKALFEELPGSDVQKKKWKEKRDQAYYGSPQHFYRSLYANELTKSGFLVYDFTRDPNPQRPPDDVIQRKLKQFKGNADSTRFWADKINLPKYTNEQLYRTPLQANQIAFSTEEPGIFAITAKSHLLYVIYTKRHEEADFRELYRPLDMENFETSVIKLYKKVAFFDMNGIIISEAPLYEGTWSKAKLAELLPVDYMP
ncbi:carboxypeptidase-like regulatory domain-containing protein [Mucilaginibacter limnophilus]|uniref:Carboxypeptidase-like regulatory domain-containing protein n=1 Tax=Mucilaginibacter limnophilus TaxID=1932778 RepID=A0A437MY92_9SPHI|nr:carboxypeptidase-like regulatory domain-containing protein [Mucilaginibacter limnophilus]RVU02652.1 carboxypeptidase-like regulatory domain-containing protein [Mucilaginibacter limnophilus]